MERRRQIFGSSFLAATGSLPNNSIIQTGPASIPIFGNMWGCTVKIFWLHVGETHSTYLEYRNG